MLVEIYLIVTSLANKNMKNITGLYFCCSAMVKPLVLLTDCLIFRSSRLEVFCKKGVLSQNSQENTCARVSLLIKLWA